MANEFMVTTIGHFLGFLPLMSMFYRDIEIISSRMMQIDASIWFIVILCQLLFHATVILITDHINISLALEKPIHKRWNGQHFADDIFMKI